MLGYEYPILGIFWTMLMFFIWIAWFVLLFRVIFDVFRSKDLSGWGKAGWCLLVIIIPLIGVLIYIIARGSGMTDRDIAQAQAQKADFDAYVRETAGSGGGVAGELEKLSQLKDQGVITDEEFAAQKAKLLA